MKEIKDFKLLPLSVESQLSRDDLEKYYKEFRQYVLQRKLTNTTIGATFFGPRLKKITEKICIFTTKAFTVKGVEWISEYEEPLPQGALLFAHNHQGILDNFVWIPTVDRHCLALHHSNVNKLLIACQLNTGLVLVNKESKESRKNAKLDMIRLLLCGYSIAYFPEGTWNLSPNKLLLPMSYGFLDVARKANVPVIPVAHMYVYDTKNGSKKIKKIHTRYGKPIFISHIDNIEQKLEEYKESVATMLWNMYEQNGIFKRESISEKEYIEYLKTNFNGLKLGKVDWQRENRNIYGANNEFYKYHFINDVQFDKNGKMMESPNNRAY